MFFIVVMSLPPVLEIWTLRNSGVWWSKIFGYLEKSILFKILEIFERGRIKFLEVLGKWILCWSHFAENSGNFCLPTLGNFPGFFGALGRIFLELSQLQNFACWALQNTAGEQIPGSIPAAVHPSNTSYLILIIIRIIIIFKIIWIIRRMLKLKMLPKNMWRNHGLVCHIGWFEGQNV